MLPVTFGPLVGAFVKAYSASGSGAMICSCEFILPKTRVFGGPKMIDNLENIGKGAQSVANSDNFDRSGAFKCFLTRFDKCCLRRSGAA